MEPFDIDKIIREKLLESHDLHKQEMDAAKPFVWSAVQKKTGRKQGLTWIHLAAAVLILMISFSFILFRVQKEHINEMKALTGKIQQLENNYLTQLETVQEKDAHVKSLAGELKHLELMLAEVNQQKPITQKENTVYRIDTVYLKQVEYITTISNPIESVEQALEQPESNHERIETTLAQHRKTDEIIFPSYQSLVKSQSSETIKFRFGTFDTKAN